MAQSPVSLACELPADCSSTELRTSALRPSSLSGLSRKSSSMRAGTPLVPSTAAMACANQKVA